MCERERARENGGGERERRGSTRVCEREGEKERGRYWGGETGVNVCVCVRESKREWGEREWERGESERG